VKKRNDYLKLSCRYRAPYFNQAGKKKKQRGGKKRAERGEKKMMTKNVIT